MKKYIALLLFLLFSLNSHADLKAIGRGGENPFDVFCFKNEKWEGKCENTDHVQPSTYNDAFFAKNTKESIAFGFNLKYNKRTFMAACKADSDINWRDCTPDHTNIPVDSYLDTRPGHDGNGSFMLIGIKDKKDDIIGNLVASCRNAEGIWTDCSPPVATTVYDLSNGIAVGYGQEEWIVLPGPSSKKSVTALCMNANTFIWRNCDILIDEPALNPPILNAIQYISTEQQWVATGRVSTGINYEANFISFCRKDNETIWTDCTGGAWLASYEGVRLAQNSQGELLQLNIGGTVICKAPNSFWRDCTENLNIDYSTVYASVTGNEEGGWVLTGKQVTNTPSKKYIITALQQDNYWEVLQQPLSDDKSFLVDVFLVD